MSKVLLSYFSYDDVDVMYDAIAQELQNNNNEVLKFNVSGIINFDSSEDSDLTNQFCLKKIKEFNPDLVFSFNNSFPPNLSRILDCEIFIFDADNPNFFWNKQNLLKNSSRYRFIGMMNGSRKIYESFLGRDLKSSEYMYLPPATFMKSENLQKSSNISFIGSNFYPSFLDGDLKHLAKIDKRLISKLYDDLQTNYFANAEDLYKNKYHQYEEFVDYDRFRKIHNAVDRLYTGQNRLEYLSVLRDLGLVIYGVRWDHIYSYDLQLVPSLNDKKILSIKDNEDVYNSSKISVNISHPQAITAFSWRVTDIMASSSCLVIEDKPDWHDLFGGLVSDKVKDAIIYKDRFEMREKCIRLLDDEKLRQQCVEECNSAIETNGRWSSRFKMIEEFCVKNLGKTNLQLVKVESDVRSKIMKLDKHSLPKKEVVLIAVSKKRKKMKLRTRARLANIVSGVILALGQIPIIDKVLISKSARRFLYKIIDNNKR